MSRTVEWSVLANVQSAEPDSLALPSIHLPDLQVGKPFSLQLPMPTATGAWSTAVALPDGLSMNNTGLVSGTPTTAGQPWPKFIFSEPN